MPENLPKKPSSKSSATSTNGYRIYRGWVQHTRRKPKPHRLKYRYFQVWLPLKQLHALPSLSRSWSLEKRNLVSFYRKHYLPGKHNNLIDQVRDRIKDNTGKHFDGDIYLLANLSYWGVCYNPVIFFFCYDNEQNLRYILSEIHNTPWKERFTYVHDLSIATPIEHNDGTMEYGFAFDKAFHVSPFMPMDIDYKWRFQVSDERININMQLTQQQESLFNASMHLQGQTLTQRQANKIPFQYPFMCIKVLASIYWNALKLWIKGVEFHPHPNHRRP